MGIVKIEEIEEDVEDAGYIPREYSIDVLSFLKFLRMF